MIFSVARLRLLAFTPLLLASLACSIEDSLFTSSVTYCAPPESLLVQQFDVAYIAKNSSIFFNISAASVEPNVTVHANLFLNVYGMQPLNLTIDLCSLLDGALCPLPMYNFTGSDSLTLPSSLGLSKRIPKIAFKIPDLEAFAQLTLIEVGTGRVKACVQSTLSNGWSTHQIGVEWTLGAIALLALVFAVGQSLTGTPDALVPFRLLDLLFLYQSIATSGFLNLNYPSLYRSFTLNFAWSMGLVFTSASSSVQRSINNMRHLTGGNMANASDGSAIGYVNRKLSPYNVAYVIPHSFLPTSKSLSTLNFTDISTRVFSSKSPLGIMQLSAGEVQTVTQSSPNILQAGVPIYVNSINIATANAFMTVFICSLILAVIALGLFGLGYLGVLAMNHYGWGKEERRIEMKNAYPSFARAWALRLCLIAFAPIVIFAVYQWTLKDSWLSILLSDILLIFILGCVLYPTILTMRLAFRSTPYSLYTTTQHLALYGPLFAQYRTSRYYFFLLLIVVTVLKALFIALAQARGGVQIIVMTVIEFLVVLAHIILRPSKTRGGDVLGTFLAIMRFLATALMIAFVERLALAAIPRVVVGIVVAVIFSVAVIVMFVNILMHGLKAFWPIDGRLRCVRRSQQESSDESMLEKGNAGSEPASYYHHRRPQNPTPEHNIPLDPGVNQPYLVTPATTITVERQEGVHSYAESASASASVSASVSTNYGSHQLPHRWSFSRTSSLRSNSPRFVPSVSSTSSSTAAATDVHPR